MAQVGLTNPSVVINNISIAVVPNTVAFTEGLGEQVVKTQAAGNNSVESVYFDNAETKLSMVKFSLYPTEDNIKRVREWKTNANANAITISGENGFNRGFANMALTTQYEVQLGTDQPFEVSFEGDPAV